MDLPKKKLLDMYKKMVAIRAFEESLIEPVGSGELPGFVHLGVGQEAAMVGIVSALRPTDWISSSHREHGIMIAREAHMGRIRAEIFGKATGYCKGKGGAMHLAVYEKCATGCNGILGPSQTINNGIALALKRLEQDDLAVVIFGDGAAHRGEFHEALNLAAIWKLPALAICIKDQEGLGGCGDDLCAVADRSAGVVGYGIRGLTADGCDVMAVYEAVSETAKHIRAGKGPALIELKAVRFRGHWEGDPHTYRSHEQLEEDRKRDGIALLASQLLEQGFATDKDLRDLRDEVEEELQESIRFTEESEYPSLEEIYTDLFYEEERRL